MAIFERFEMAMNLLLGGLVLAGILAMPDQANAGGKGSACGDAFVPLSQIQGPGPRSPLSGQEVTVEAIVTGTFAGEDRLSGFYIASAPADADDDPATSEGLFVHEPGRFNDVSLEAGDRVRVQGRVREFHGLTELASVESLLSCGRAQRLAAPRPLEWPLENLERQEAMLVTVPSLVVIGQWDLARYGSLQVAPERLYTPTQLVPPGAQARSKARTLAALNRDRRILVDDGSNRTFPDNIYRLGPPGQADAARQQLRLGDRTKPMRAILDYRYGHWRLQPVSEVRIVPANNRPEPLGAPQDIRLVSFNLANFFNGNGRGGGFPTARGARTPADYRRQKQGLVAMLSQLNPDLIAVSEIENDGYGRNSAVADLSRALGEDWRYVDFSRAGAGSDAITNGILYRQNRLELVGRPATLNTGAFSHGNRPPLAAAFRHAPDPSAASAPVVVVANHFKSKRCHGATGNNAKSGDGQACWASLRESAAKDLLRWLQTDPTGAGTNASILLGDFNSYRQEDSMQVFDQAGFATPIDPEAYTYVYDGLIGSLDYAWVSGNLAGGILDSGVWHANVDERRHGQGAPNSPWGVSDHDPVWIDMRFPLGVTRYE